MKIYTRTGDAGETGLFGGGRVRKDHRRVDAYGEVDELNAAIGFAVVAMEDEADPFVERMRLIQEDLFAIGSHLSTPETAGGKAASHLPPLPLERIGEMEQWIDDTD